MTKIANDKQHARIAPGWMAAAGALLIGFAGGFSLKLWTPTPKVPAITATVGAPTVPPTTTPSRRSFVPDKPLAERLLLVTIDGLRPDLLAVANTPNLRALALGGSYTFWAQTVADPYVYTLPAHTSILTGVNPDRHGVTWNTYIEESYPNVPTVFELAKARGLTTALVSGKMKFIALAKPGTLDWTYLPPDEPVDDSAIARQAIAILRQHRPNLLFVHFPGVDTTGHAFGWGSAEQRGAVEAADASLGELLTALRAAGLAAETFILVTADHGGADISHYNGDPRSRTIPWIASGPGVRVGVDLTREPFLTVRAEDTFATVCGVLGIPLPPGTEGRFVEQIIAGRELLHSTSGTDTATSGPARRSRPLTRPN